MEHVLDFLSHFNVQRMTSLSMRCANKAVPEAAARMRASGKRSRQDSAAGVDSSADANNQLAILNGAGARCHPRATS